MNTSAIWIVIAAVAVLLVLVLAVLLTRARRRRQERRAEQIRENARLESAKVERREVLAQETAAKARAAQAEAEVKAAEAAKLQDRAAKHQSDLSASRQQLEEQWNRADQIDPNTGKRSATADERETVSRPGRGEASAEPRTHDGAGTGAGTAEHYREAPADRRDTSADRPGTG